MHAHVNGRLANNDFPWKTKVVIIHPCHILSQYVLAKNFQYRLVDAKYYSWLPNPSNFLKRTTLFLNGNRRHHIWLYYRLSPNVTLHIYSYFCIGAWKNNGMYIITWVLYIDTHSSQRNKFTAYFFFNILVLFLSQSQKHGYALFSDFSTVLTNV